MTWRAFCVRSRGSSRGQRRATSRLPHPSAGRACHLDVDSRPAFSLAEHDGRSVGRAFGTAMRTGDQRAQARRLGRLRGGTDAMVTKAATAHVFGVENVTRV